MFCVANVSVAVVAMPPYSMYALRILRYRTFKAALASSFYAEFGKPRSASCFFFYVCGGGFLLGMIEVVSMADIDAAAIVITLLEAVIGNFATTVVS